MTMRCRRSAFTLVELLVVIAVMGILLALLLPAIQKAREASMRTQCQSNLRQVAIAMHSFNDARQRMPVYSGVDNGYEGGPTASYNPTFPFGSYFVPLLPFLDEKALYDSIAAWCLQNNDNTGNQVWSGSSPTSGSWSCTCSSATYNPGTGPSGPVFGPPVTVTVPTTTVPYNGHTVTNPGYTYTTTPVISYTNPGTPAFCTGGSGAGCPGTPTFVSGNPGTGTQDYTGVWWSSSRTKKFGVLLCPADFSATPKGVVTVTGLQWGATNYVANWWMWGVFSPPGYLSSSSGSLTSVPDGPSNTILFAEVYSQCDTVDGTTPFGRPALLLYNPNPTLPSYNYTFHNFGITWPGAFGNAPDTSQPQQSWPDGMPNTFMFQVQPQALPNSQCPANRQCCNNWTVQTPHIVLNAAMADGSVKAVAGTVSSTTWSRAMTPNDGQALGGDW
jgi:prepilin-type N-terminal cleavage/methylation domain-containing protein